MKKLMSLLLLTLVTASLSASGRLRINRFDLTPVPCDNQEGTARMVLGAAGGVPPYQFRLDGGEFQDSNVFEGLDAGDQEFEVRDSAGNRLDTRTFVGPSVYTNIVVSTRPYCNDQTMVIYSIATEGPGSAKAMNRLINDLDSSILQEIIGNGDFAPITPLPFLIVRSIPPSVSDDCPATDFRFVPGVPDPLEVSAKATEKDCTTDEGGTITVSAIGGIPPYEFSINGTDFQESNFFDNVNSGDYTVTVRDTNGCTDSTSATVDFFRSLTSNRVTNFTIEKYCKDVPC